MAYFQQLIIVIFDMNLIRNIFKVSHVSHLFFRNYNASKANLIIFHRTYLRFLIKKGFLNYSTYPENSSLVREPVSLSKKRLSKKKKWQVDEEEKGYLVKAFCTAEEYNLEKLSLALQKCTAFEPTTFDSDLGNSVDVIHAKKNSKTESVDQDLFFFREGCVVMWNVQDLETKNIINLLKSYEDNGFVNSIIENESEILSYSISDNVAKSLIVKHNLLLCSDDNLLDKYAISNAMALSVQLGTYEASLEQYIETMEPVTEDLKSGNKIKMTRNEVLQKTGQLFALRHNINLNSDLLDTPDFYWDREELETLYQTTFNYYCINKRTKVINEKINHCIELVDLLSSHLNDKHHIRLEWMIIILIMVEVAFEVFHCLEYFGLIKGLLDH